MKILETSRVVLREFSADDAEAMTPILSDAETMRFYPAALSREEVGGWIARNIRRYAADGHGLWAMVLKSTGEVVGDCGLVTQDVDGSEELEIGYHVRRDLWGQGLATEAARACRGLGFARFDVRRIISLIRPENAPSRRVAEKNGMTVIKETVRKGLLHLVYAISREQHSKLSP
jgi:RimJ/RimL family protein N-acetyltransferase